MQFIKKEKIFFLNKPAILLQQTAVFSNNQEHIETFKSLLTQFLLSSNTNSPQSAVDYHVTFKFSHQKKSKQTILLYTSRVNTSVIDNITHSPSLFRHHARWLTGKVVLNLLWYVNWSCGLDVLIP